MKTLYLLGLFWVIIMPAFAQSRFSLDIGESIGIYQYQRFHFRPNEHETTYWSNGTALSFRLNYHIPQKWLFSLGAAHEWMPYTIPLKGLTTGKDFEAIRIKYTHLEFNFQVGKTFEKGRWSFTPTFGLAVIVSDPSWRVPLFIEGASSTNVPSATDITTYYIDYEVGTLGGAHENILLESGVVGEYAISKRFSLWWQFNFRWAVLQQSLPYYLVYNITNDSNDDSVDGLDIMYFAHNGFRLGFGLRYSIPIHSKKKKRR